MATYLERIFALPLNTLAGDDDFTYTALSNDASNTRTGNSIRTSFQSKLPGYLNFANTKKRGREDRDEENLSEEWRVTLHKALINNFPENAPVVKVLQDNGQLVYSKKLPAGYYPNLNAVLRQTYDTLQENLVHIQVPQYTQVFREQYIFHYTWKGSVKKEVAFLRQFDDANNRTLDTHQEYIHALFSADARVQQVLDVLVGSMVNNTTVYSFADKKATLRERYEAYRIIGSTFPTTSGYGYYKKSGVYYLKPYNHNLLYHHDYKNRFCFSEAMAIMLGLHDSKNYNLINGTTVSKQSDGVYVVNFQNQHSQLTWTSHALQEKYASVLQHVVKRPVAALKLQIDPALKTVRVKTEKNIRIILVNKKDTLLNTFVDGDQISFTDFFADTLYRDHMQSEAMRVNTPNLEFLNRIQGTGDNLNTLLHPLIPVPMEERVVAFYPKPEKYERKLTKKRHVDQLEVTLRDAWNSGLEPVLYTGANVFVLTFYRGRGIDWY